MAFIFFPTLVVAALGLFAARAGDLLRSPLFERKPCAANASAVVWEYEATPREPRGVGPRNAARCVVSGSPQRKLLNVGAPGLAFETWETSREPKHSAYEPALSASRIARFRSTPQRYPVRDPSAPTTRWHGTISATRFVAQARATARVALGSPISRATSL